MLPVKCPIDGCEYETPDVDTVIVAALITTHATSQPTQAARAEKVKRLSISLVGMTEDWLYRTGCTSSKGYVKATEQEGAGRIIQLLECCDEQLCRDLTRNAGGG